MQPGEARFRTPPITFVAIAGFAALTVYCTWMSIHSSDLGTGLVAPGESLKHYRQALAGTRPLDDHAE